METSEDTAIREALGRLRHSVDVPPVDPARESALIAAFDARRIRPAKAKWSSLPAFIAAAALILITVSLNWLVVLRAPVVTNVNAEAVADLAGFVLWPGAGAWPPFESGSLIRVDLPVSMLPALGLSAPSSASGVVPADIVVGQDGLARAIRLVQQP